MKKIIPLPGAYFIYRGEVCRVESIDRHDHVNLENHASVPAEELVPIKIDAYSMFICKNCTIELISLDGSTVANIEANGFACTMVVDYLHELQNLLLVATVENLTLKNKS